MRAFYQTTVGSRPDTSFPHVVLSGIGEGEETMMRWLTLILSVVLLGVVLAPGIRGEVPFGAAEATFVVT